MEKTCLGDWVECKECLEFDDCPNCEDRDGCFHGSIGERGPRGPAPAFHICLNCKKKVLASLHNELRTINIKGKPITYWYETWICNECGQEVWDGDADDHNANEPWRVYNLKYNKTK